MRVSNAVKKLYIIIFLFFLVGVRPGLAEKDSFGMILDAKGAATVVSKGKESKARPMMPLFSGSVITTGKAATVDFVSFEEGKEYRIQPDSRVTIVLNRFDSQKGQVIAKTAASKLPLPTNTSVSSKKTLGEALRPLNDGDSPVPDAPLLPEEKDKIKDLTILFPMNMQVLADPAFSARWAGGKSKEYEILLIDAKSKAVLKPLPVTVENTGKYITPNGPSLEYGKTYVLVLKGKDPSGKKESRQISFSVLSKDKAAKVIEARNRFDEIMKAEPNNKMAILLMADFYKENGMFHQAIVLLHKLERLDPQNPYVFYYLGELYGRIGCPNTSTSLYEKGKKIDEKG